MSATGGTVFGADQTITLAVSGTASETADYTIDSRSLTLPAGDTSVTVGVRAAPHRDASRHVAFRAFDLDEPYTPSREGTVAVDRFGHGVLGEPPARERERDDGVGVWRSYPGLEFRYVLSTSHRVPQDGAELGDASLALVLHPLDGERRRFDRAYPIRTEWGRPWSTPCPRVRPRLPGAVAGGSSAQLGTPNPLHETQGYER